MREATSEPTQPVSVVRQRASGFWSSLKVRITVAGISALALAIAVITAILVSGAERDTLTYQRHRELGESVRTAGVLSRNVVELQRALALVASQLDPATLASEEALVLFLQDKLVLRSMFSNIFVALANGQIIGFADERGVRRVDVNLADRGYFKRTLSEGRPLISDAVPGRLSGEAVVVLTQPLRGAAGIYAVFGGALRLSSRDLLANWVDTLESDELAMVVVTDAAGKILAHPNVDRLMHSLAEEPRLAQAYAAWTEAGRPVEPSGLQEPQAGEVVSAAGVPGPDWMVWRVRPESELLGPLHSARRRAMAWAGGLIALMSIATLAFLAWLFRPLGLLEERAQHLFDGQLPAHAGWPDAGGDIGRLVQVLKQVGTERVTLEQANSELLKRLGSVMTASHIGIAFTRNQYFERVSAEFCRLFKRSEADFVGQHAAFIYASREDYDRLGPLVQQAFRSGQAYVGEWAMLRSNGSQFWAALRGSPVDMEDPSAGTIWTVNDVSEQKLAQQALEWSATHDPLTRLANRREFERRAELLIERTARDDPAAMICIDLDHFKPINDKAGHAAGDAMLVAVAQALSAAVRSSDLVARLGGDEFAVLLDRCSEAVASRIAETLRQAVESISVRWQQQAFSVGASLGVAGLAAHTSVNAWMVAADTACYAAKSAGRGRVRTTSEGAAEVANFDRVQRNGQAAN